MKVYAVRWLSRIDGEEKCGNFEVCYADENDARKAMLADVENTKADWEGNFKDYLGKIGEKVKSRFLGPGGDGKDDCDYAGIWIEDGNGDGTYDYHDWWIDELEVK